MQLLLYIVRKIYFTFMYIFILKYVKQQKILISDYYV